MRLLRICWLSLFLLLFGYPQLAAAFIVQDIQVEGAYGVNRETILNYLPIHVGEDFSPSQSTHVISTLYASGLFGNVSLARKGNVLIVRVEERPVISCINVTGNKAIPTDKIYEVLKNIGLSAGQTFDQATLDHIVHSLENEYDTLGKYNAKVTPCITHLARNRIAIRLDISEGRTVVVKKITFIGNCAFSSWTLKRQMSLTSFRPWSFFTHSDQFCQDKLNASLDAIRNYYLDRGYLNFKVDSAQAVLTPDRNCVEVIIHVNEGCVYRIKGYQLAGNLIIPREYLAKLVTFHPGDIFSKQKIQHTNLCISKSLGNMGYIFATVNVEPQVDESCKQVFLTLYVDPGNRIYVRRINFCGNTKTEDIVLRRSLRQYEASLAVAEDIQESDRQLNLTGYLADPIHAETIPIPGVLDQVDLNYKVAESPSASATAGVGYGTQGYVITAGINQPNFLGTGNIFSINANTSLYSKSVNVTYLNPFYTDSGISRGFTLYGQRTTPGNVNLTSYATDVYGGSVNYSIPISACGDTLQFGFGYQDLLLSIGSNPSLQLQNFVDTYGTHFNQILLTAGWARNRLDRAVFPTCGLYQALNLQVALPAANHSVSYYKSSYNFNYYHPIVKSFIFTARGAVAYGAGLGGTKGLPFFVNYYAGGIGSTGEVRGFNPNSLGPRDTINGIVNDPMGGNELVTGTLGIIFPNPLGEDKLRTMVFVDGGNVYSTKAVEFGGTGAGPIRYSAGVAADWRVPVMNVLVEVAVAKALNPQPGDNKRIFDFSIGTSF